MERVIEVWKEIKDYPGYEVSNLGRVRSKRECHRNLIFDGYRLLKLQKTYKGYYKAFLYNENGRKGIFVHRLVMNAFVPNPDNLPMINHRDECKTNNTIIIDEQGNVIDGNLEWCDNSYNMRYNGCSEKRAQKTMVKVDQYSLEGEYIKTYNSIREAAKDNKIINPSQISGVCFGKYKTAGGYIWKFSEKITNRKRHIGFEKKEKAVSMLTNDGRVIRTFENTAIASNHLGYKKGSQIAACCDGRVGQALGFKWKWA